MKKINLLLSLIMLSASVYSQGTTPNPNATTHNYSDGIIVNFGYVNDQDWGQNDFLCFRVKKYDGTNVEFSIPADNTRTDVEINRLLSIISSAFYTQSNVRIYHNNFWIRHDGSKYHLADRIHVGEF